MWRATSCSPRWGWEDSAGTAFASIRLSCLSFSHLLPRLHSASASCLRLPPIFLSCLGRQSWEASGWSADLWSQQQTLSHSDGCMKAHWRSPLYSASTLQLHIHNDPMKRLQVWDFPKNTLYQVRLLNRLLTPKKRGYLGQGYNSFEFFNSFYFYFIFQFHYFNLV